MRSRILAAILVVAAAVVPAAATPRCEVMADLAPNLATEADRALYAAVQRQRADEHSVRDTSMLIDQAERELAIAHLERQISLENRDRALQRGATEAARTWAPRHAKALQDETDAFARVLQLRIARDRARAEQARSSAEVRHAGELAQRDARG